jgi:hypothetical protein
MPCLGLSHHLDLQVTFYVRQLCLTSARRAVEEASVNPKLSLLVGSSDFHCTQDIDFCHLHILLCSKVLVSVVLFGHLQHRHRDFGAGGFG